MKTNILWLVLTVLTFTACKPTPPPPPPTVMEQIEKKVDGFLTDLEAEVKSQERKRKWNKVVDGVSDKLKADTWW